MLPTKVALLTENRSQYRLEVLAARAAGVHVRPDAGVAPLKGEVGAAGITALILTRYFQ